MSEEGTVELKIYRFSEFVRDQGSRVSAPTYIYGLPWKISAHWIFSGYMLSGRSEALGYFVQCNEKVDDSNWSCQASVELQIVSQKAGVDDHVREFVTTFSSNNIYVGDNSFISFDVLHDPEKGFIKDNVVILRAHVKLKKRHRRILTQAEVPQSAEMSKLRAFASSISDPPDGTLIVGTNRIPIHKMYLSYYSEYFKAMFQSKFKEGGEDEIELKEVGYVDMLQLLYVIYPFNRPITDENLKVILNLADRFIMPAVFEQCKNGLRTSTLNVAQKLLLAQQYNFKDLQKELAQQCKTIEDAKKLRSEPEYEMLDSETRLLILDSITS